MIIVCTMCATDCVIVDKEETFLEREHNLTYRLDHAVTEAAVLAYGDYSGVPIDDRQACTSHDGSAESKRLLQRLRRRQGVRQVEIYDNIIRIALTERARTDLIDDTVHQLAHEELSQ